MKKIIIYVCLTLLMTVFMTSCSSDDDSDLSSVERYHQPDEDYSQSTYSRGFEIVGNRLTIWESGCFNVSKTVYQRIPSL